MRPMRRFKQELPDVEVIYILTTGKVATWALDGDDGFPYAVPVNYVYADGAIYIHCAKEGHKIDSISRNPKCSLCIIDKDDIVPERFTTHFRSAIAFGLAKIVAPIDEKVKALQLLCEKYSPGIDPSDEIQQSIGRVAIVKVEIVKATGKQAIELVKVG